MSVINGYSYPRFKMTSTTGRVSTIDFPLTNEGGLVESYEIIKTDHTLIGLASTNDISFKQTIRGFIIRFTLDYSTFITGETLFTKVNELFAGIMAGSKIELYPRVDDTDRLFEVILDMDSFDLGIRKGGANATLHRLPVFKFKTKYMQSNFGWHPVGYNAVVSYEDPIESPQ